ncbi:MAG: nuclear transport factor 2 family protein [Acidobacteriota bacterium]
MANQELEQLEDRINGMILQGQILEAFDEFYADHCVMQEPHGTHEGKATNRKREEEWLASVKEFHGGEVKAVAIGDGVTLSEWWMDVTFQDGNRVNLEQVAVRRWEHGKIVHERFYYNAG